MALPDDFSPAQHLLSMLIGTHNRTVQQTFLGVPDADLEHPLGGMKLACMIEPDDTVDMIILRLFLYWFEFQANLPTPVYGTPIEEHQAEFEIPFKPRIKLKFIEDHSTFLAENKLRRATAEISWRLMNYTSATINPTIAKEWALKIKEKFSLNGGYKWEKGTLKVLYKDIVKGVDFRLLAVSKVEAVRVIEEVLSFIGIAFDEQKVRVASSDQNYPVIPPVAEIYGKERKLPRKRPITYVRFVRSELHIHGLPSPVVLVDRLNKGYPLVV